VRLIYHFEDRTHHPSPRQPLASVANGNGLTYSRRLALAHPAQHAGPGSRTPSPA